MKTRKLILLIVLVGFLISTGFSQHQHGRLDVKGRMNDRLDKMDEVVKFTGNQRAEVQALFEEVVKKKKDAFCSNEMGSEGMQKAMKSIRKEKNDRLKKILSKDQMKLWKDYIQEHNGDKKEKADHHGKGGKTMDDRINSKLNSITIDVLTLTHSRRVIRHKHLIHEIS